MNRTLIVLLCGLLLLWGSCSNNPTGPGQGSAPILYAVTETYAGGYFRILYIDTGTDSVIDSMLVPEGTYGPMAALGVSPDGSRLYLNGAVIDTKSKSVIPGAHWGVPTPDGKYLIYSNLDTFRVIDRHLNEVVYETDSIPLSLGRHNYTDNFDRRRGLFYGRRYDSTRGITDQIIAFDYRRLRVERIITPGEIGGYDIVVGDVAVTSDGEKLFHVSGCFTAAFICIDLNPDRVVCAYGLNGASLLGISPDDERVYITDPGCYIFEPLSQGLLQIYTTGAGDFLPPINLMGLPNPCDSIEPQRMTDQIMVHPNGRKAYVSTWAGQEILVIDIQANTVKKVLCDVGWIVNFAMEQN